MPKKTVRSIVLWGLAAVTTSACQTIIMDQLKTVSAGHTGCTPENITISNRRTTMMGNNETWNATCNGKVYLCSGVATGKSSADFSCAPAAE